MHAVIHFHLNDCSCSQASAPVTAAVHAIVLLVCSSSLPSLVQMKTKASLKNFSSSEAVIQPAQQST